MVDLPKKKVGIVACSGEELPEGTVTRLAALQVLERLRPAETVTICLPLFLAGGEGDRAFARFYPTIALDGCLLRCAARATELYSGKPAASVVVSDLPGEKPQGRRQLDEAGLRLVELAAGRVSDLVDELLGKHWDRRKGAFDEPAAEALPAEKEATCSCGSGIPVQKVLVEGQPVTLVGLPLIFQQLQQAGNLPDATTGEAILEMVKIYNPLPPGEEQKYSQVLLAEYRSFCASRPASGTLRGSA